MTATEVAGDAFAGVAGIAAPVAMPAAGCTSTGVAALLPEPKKYRNSVRFGGLVPGEAGIVAATDVGALTAAAVCADAIAGKAVAAAATGWDGAADTAP